MIAVTGANGFLGRALVRTLELRGLQIVRIGRGNAHVRWPDDGGEFGDEALARLRGVRAVVHLAGEPIGARWTTERRRAILYSRETLTGALARAVGRIVPTPSAFISASAVGYYGNRGDEWLDETSRPGDDFLAAVARKWEAATEPARAAGVRVVTLRLGVVIGPGGGMVSRLRLPFQLALGAQLGNGAQWMSWVSLDDAVRWIVRAIDDASVDGPVNVVSPEPVTNRAFTQAFARATGRPAVLTAPAFALRAAFGEMADGVLLASQRVRPARMEAFGFAHEHASLDSALATALDR